MAFNGPDTRERRDGGLSVGLACCHEVSNPLLDMGELILQPPPASDAVQLGARLRRLDRRPEPEEGGASGFQLAAGVISMPGSPEDAAKQQSCPGLLERHGQPRMPGE